MEHVDGFHLFTSTDKLDRLGYHSTDTERSTTTGITIKFGKYNTIEIQAIIKLLRCIDSILTSHGVNNEQGFIRVQMILQITDLIHHLLIDGKTAGSIDDDHIIAIGLSLLDGMISNHAYILVVWLSIYRNSHLLTYHLQLVDSSRTIYVARYEQWFLSPLGLQHISELTTEGSLTRTLQTTHQDNGRMAFELQRSLFASHQLGQLIVYQLHHQLSWLHGSKHVHTQRLFLHRVGKLLGNLKVNIGIQKCTTYILHGFSHVDFSYLTFTFQYFERAL